MRPRFVTLLACLMFTVLVRPRRYTVQLSPACLLSHAATCVSARGCEFADSAVLMEHVAAWRSKLDRCAGFLIFLWALATLVVSVALGVGIGFLAWTGGSRLWRRLHYWDRMVRGRLVKHSGKYSQIVNIHNLSHCKRLRLCISHITSAWRSFRSSCRTLPSMSFGPLRYRAHFASCFCRLPAAENMGTHTCTFCGGQRHMN